MKTITLYRPVNAVELALIEATNWKGFPPRLPDQPIFYPVTNFEYAKQITVDWNVPAYGNGYVTAFDVNADFLANYRVENVGADLHNEYWIPAEDLPAFNANIIGPIRVEFEYHQ
ncbi:ADP-ribosylation/crystallin J1 [Chitinophaga sp. Hz27]|uniref:ADP-ribosylation/crystallin J1 n=1 Tax=Chitinophaga sp. Hz27 TaxID=3347169 RepID=UPI0035D58CF9